MIQIQTAIHVYVLNFISDNVIYEQLRNLTGSHWKAPLIINVKKIQYFHIHTLYPVTLDII